MKKACLFLAALAIVGLSACSSVPQQSTEHPSAEDNSPATYLHNPSTD